MFAYGNDDDDDDNHGKSDNHTNNTYKFWVSVVPTVMICHGDDEGDVDGCRKCNCDRFGEGCCDSDDDVDCKCDVDVDDDGDGDVTGCGHVDGCGFTMNEIFFFR